MRYWRRGWLAEVRKRLPSTLQLACCFTSFRAQAETQSRVIELGTAPIHAIQRPLSSRSVSIFQCTSLLLMPADGFLSDPLIRSRYLRSVPSFRPTSSAREESARPQLPEIRPRRWGSPAHSRSGSCRELRTLPD